MIPNSMVPIITIIIIIIIVAVYSHKTKMYEKLVGSNARILLIDTLGL